MQTVAGSAPASRQAAARTALLHCGEQPQDHTFTADWVTQPSAGPQQEQEQQFSHSVVGIDPFSLMSFLVNFAPTFKTAFKKIPKNP